MLFAIKTQSYCEEKDVYLPCLWSCLTTQTRQLSPAWAHVSWTVKLKWKKQQQKNWKTPDYEWPVIPLCRPICLTVSTLAVVDFAFGVEPTEADWSVFLELVVWYRNRRGLSGWKALWLVYVEFALIIQAVLLLNIIISSCINDPYRPNVLPRLLNRFSICLQREARAPRRSTKHD